MSIAVLPHQRNDSEYHDEAPLKFVSNLRIHIRINWTYVKSKCLKFLKSYLLKAKSIGIYTKNKTWRQIYDELDRKMIWTGRAHCVGAIICPYYKSHYLLL